MKRGDVSMRSDAVLFVLAMAATMPLMLAEDWTEPISAGIAAGVLALTAACGLGGLVRRPADPPAFMRRICVALIVIGSLLLVMFELFIRRHIPVVALGHFAMLLAAAKLLDMRSARDRADVLVISLLTMVMGAMISANVAFGVVLGLYILVGGLWIMRFRTATEARECWQRQLARLAAARGRGAGRPGLPSETAPLNAPRLWPLASWYSMVITIIVVVLFVMMPRQIGRRLDFGVSAALTDFTTAVDLNQIGALLESDQPVMRVRIKRDGVPITDAEPWLYLRGATQTRYIGHEWRVGPRGARTNLAVPPDNNPQSLYFDSVGALQAGRLEQEFWLDQLNEPVLFSLYPPAIIASMDIRAVQFIPRDMSLRLLRSPGRPTHYRVVSPVGPNFEALEQAVEEAAPPAPPTNDPPRASRNLTQRTGERRLAAADEPSINSDISERVRDFARQIAGIGEQPPIRQQWFAAAKAIESHLQSNQYTYSLQAPTRIRGRDPLEVFLFESRTGFCQHFASAMTVMCQSLGIDARLVVGYSGGEYNTVGGFYRIRRKDAHAWVEVRLPDRGWTTFDPTPARDPSNRRRTDGLGAMLTRWYDFLQFEWASLVVTFDAPHRQEMWDALKRWWTRLSTPAGGARGWSDWAGELLWGPTVFPLHLRVLYWIMLVLIAVLGVLTCRAAWIISLIVRENLPRRQRAGRTRIHKPDARFYDRLLVQLARLGHVKAPHQTPEEFALQLAGRYSSLARVVELTEWYYETEYGGHELDDSRRRGIAQWLGNLRIHGTFDPPPPAGT